MTLAEPLARALHRLVWPHGLMGDRPESRKDTERRTAAILAAMRADPATVAAIAEALHALDLFSPDFEGDCTDHTKDAAALADALFGAKP